jgi:hypothetical protein
LDLILSSQGKKLVLPFGIALSQTLETNSRPSRNYISKLINQCNMFISTFYTSLLHCVLQALSLTCKYVDPHLLKTCSKFFWGPSEVYFWCVLKKNDWLKPTALPIYQGTAFLWGAPAIMG